MKATDRLALELGLRHILMRWVTAVWAVTGVLVLAQPARAGWVAATGGTETYYEQNGIYYHAHIFSDVGAGTFTVTQGGEVEYLVVGGGGGGGGAYHENNGGGGGFYNNGGNGGSGIVILRYPLPRGTCVLVY